MFLYDGFLRRFLTMLEQGPDRIMWIQCNKVFWIIITFILQNELFELKMLCSMYVFVFFVFKWKKFQVYAPYKIQYTHTNALRHSHMKDILLWYLLHKRQEFLDSFCRFGCMHVYLWYVPCVTFYIWCQIHWSWCSGPIKQSSYAIAMNSQ